MEIRTNLAASVVGIGIDEVTRAVKHARSAREIGCRGDEGNLIDFVGVASIDIDEQVAVGLDMEANCSVHGYVSRRMVRGNTVRQGAVGHAFHIGLVDTRAQFAAEVAIDGKPFLGDLPLKLYVWRWGKGDILITGEQLSAPDIQVKVHARMDIKTLAAVGIEGLYADSVPRVIERVGNGIGGNESVYRREVRTDAMAAHLIAEVEHRAHLMFGGVLRQSKEGVARLHLVLEVLLLVALHAHKGIHAPRRLLVFRLQLAGLLYGESFRSGVEIVSVTSVEAVASLQAEIELTGGETVPELKPEAGTAVGASAPFCTVVGIDLELVLGFLPAVVQPVELIRKIEEGVCMPESTAHIAVQRCRLRKARGLAQQVVGVEGWA